MYSTWCLRSSSQFPLPDLQRLRADARYSFIAGQAKQQQTTANNGREPEHLGAPLIWRATPSSSPINSAGSAYCVFLPGNIFCVGTTLVIKWTYTGRGRRQVLDMQQEEAGMHYVEFFTSINPIVLGVLAVVVVCGIYDHWLETHHK